MYFKSRPQAGRMIADKLKHYQGEHCVVVALNQGGVLVGAQIAMRLHAGLLILMSEKITLPGEESSPLAMMTTDTFTYNSGLSQGQVDEFTSEYQGLIGEQRLEKLHRLNRLLIDEGGEINRAQLRHHIVILVSDGLLNSAMLDVAADFLKPVKMTKLVIVTPIATINAVDRMHLLGDDIVCLSVSENLMDINHYYEENDIPDQEGLMKITHNIALNWQT